MIAAIVGVLTLIAGVWALVDPQSFYDQVATWPPYNRHFLHDVGAFQTGLGATLVLALFMRDALLLGLTGVGIGAVLHAVSHAVDRDLGGRSSDPITLGIVAAVIAVGALLRARDVARR